MKHMKDRVGNFFFFFDFAGHGRMVQKYLVWLLFEDSSLLCAGFQLKLLVYTCICQINTLYTSSTKSNKKMGGHASILSMSIGYSLIPRWNGSGTIKGVWQGIPTMNRIF